MLDLYGDSLLKDSVTLPDGRSVELRYYGLFDRYYIWECHGGHAVRQLGPGALYIDEARELLGLGVARLSRDGVAAAKATA